MSSIKPPSQVELTRLKSIAERLSMAWSTLSVSEMLQEIVVDNRFVRNPAVVSSFGADSAVLLHMISQIQPEAQVVFLDTGFHFKETIRYRNHLISTFGLKNVRTASVDPLAIKRRDPTRRLHQSQPDQCCQLRKVSVLDRHLRMNDAWVTGQRRAQSATRSAVALVEVDEARGRLKFNPLANFGDSEIAAYKIAHRLPEHPLVTKGYPSIGCEPCTTAVQVGEDPRSGRWRGKEKLECGLHNRSNIIASSEHVA